MRPIISHACVLLLGLLFIILALLDFSTPTAQLVVSTFLLIGGVVAAGIVFRTNYAHNNFLTGVEIVLFLISVLIAVGVVIDVGMNWSEFQARK